MYHHMKYENRNFRTQYFFSMLQLQVLYEPAFLTILNPISDMLYLTIYKKYQYNQLIMQDCPSIKYYDQIQSKQWFLGGNSGINHDSPLFKDCINPLHNLINEWISDPKVCAPCKSEMEKTDNFSSSRLYLNHILNNAKLRLRTSEYQKKCLNQALTREIKDMPKNVFCMNCTTFEVKSQ